MKHTTTALNIVSSLGKFYRGVPGEPRQPFTGLGNVAQVVQFLVARKLGLGPRGRVRLGNAGCVHLWPLIERSDLSVLEEVFLQGEYALDVPSPKVVFDLGANFGAASVYFAQGWPDARIISVEPNPPTFRRLVETTAPYPNITCLNYAISYKDGTADFVVSEDHIAASLYRPDPNGMIVKVETRALRSLMVEMKVEHIDVLKFDVEGAEEDVFHDSSVLSRIDVLVGEVHKDLLHMSPDKFLALFADFEVAKRSESADLFVMTASRRRSHRL
jgi:FkbM family methyltransferase